MLLVFLQAAHEQAQRSSALSSGAGPTSMSISFTHLAASTAKSEPEQVADTSGLISAHKVTHFAGLTVHAILQS